MAQNGHSVGVQPSRLLQLPRELRDVIIDHVLVRRRNIPIECAITVTPPRAQNQRGRGPSTPPETEYPLRNPRVHRRVWSVPLFDVADSNLHEYAMENHDVRMTYQLECGEYQSELAKFGSNLALFRTCKQIYGEASKIFYSRNIFCFSSDFRIPTAFAFLCDRPAASLLHIRSLELGLLEANNIRGTTRAHYPVINRSTDSLVLQFAYQYFTDLCMLLSTPRIRLRHLRLTVETMWHDSEDGFLGLRECLAWEEQNMKGARPWTPLWLEPLLKIEELESLEIRWVANRPQLLRMEDAIQTIQRHMLPGYRSIDAVHTQTRTDTHFPNLAFKFLQQDRENPLVGYHDFDDTARDMHGTPIEPGSQETNDIIWGFTEATSCLGLLLHYDATYASFFALKRA